ncbi:MAG: hypothetical protein A2086_16080 [Spirochaetes bacterium GWD1_27_9]|nr:MAG: hypothetical protein A2Z98_15575 [Spirochaetes bacterium GWB1_27_13]OHD24273.1 MAG: hypothetical protein A2Y34_11275 [Spirochaetes bacterium GWC1_27_15]OHD36233.1 MAG: hypothetical protein A2086_16080 [Spirochaetes bacterium GWD1_27_9]
MFKRCLILVFSVLSLSIVFSENSTYQNSVFYKYLNNTTDSVYKEKLKKDFISLDSSSDFDIIPIDESLFVKSKDILDDSTKVDIRNLKSFSLETAAIIGISDFLIKRAETEIYNSLFYSGYFEDTIKSMKDDSEDLSLFFPSTLSLIKNSNFSDTRSLFNPFIKSLSNDLINMLNNIILSRPNNQTIKILFTFTTELKKNEFPIKTLMELSNIDISIEKDNQLLKELKSIGIFFTDYYFITKIEDLSTDENYKEYYNSYSTKKTEIFNNYLQLDKDVKFDTIKSKIKEYINKFYDDQKIIDQKINDKKADNKTKIANNLQYTVSAMNYISAKLFPKSNNLNQLIDFLKRFYQMYQSVEDKDYQNIAINTINLLNKLYEIGLFEAKKYGITGLNNDRTDDPFTKQILTLEVLTKFFTFAGNIASAKTPKDIQKAIEDFALPPGGYQLKRKFEYSFYITINAYIGTSIGFDSYKNKNKDELIFPQLGFNPITAPIGFEFGWSYKNKFFKSLGLFCSILDFGSVISWRLQDPNNFTGVTSIGFSQLFAPGFYLVLGVSTIPLSIGLGGQFMPYYSDLLNKDNDKQYYLTFRAFFGVDLTIFNIYRIKTTKKQKKQNDF